MSEPVEVRPLTRRARRERDASAVAGVAASSSAEQAVIAAAKSVLAPDDALPASTQDVVATRKKTVAEKVPVAAKRTAPEKKSAGKKAPAAKTPAKKAPVKKAVVTETVPAASDVDMFAVASKMLGTSAPSIPMNPATAGELTLPAKATAHRAPRRARRRAVAGAASVGVMGLAALLAVTMTMPAQAIAVAQANDTTVTSSLVADKESRSSVPEDQIQAFVASSDVHNDAIQRSGEFSTLSLAQVAAESGIKYSNAIYTNDIEAAIQWPIKVGVGMTYGYGMRSGRLHAGIDLVPGNGAPIQAIADGVVRIATESGGGYGVTAYVDHVIDGKVITSHYSHMQYGSLAVKQGDKVKVGDLIGLVGNTGQSFGAHLHFELIVNGSTIDPLPWLKANAGRYEY